MWREEERHAGCAAALTLRRGKEGHEGEGEESGLHCCCLEGG